jgi:hypothetical protein
VVAFEGVTAGVVVGAVLGVEEVAVVADPGRGVVAAEESG